MFKNIISLCLMIALCAVSLLASPEMASAVVSSEVFSVDFDQAAFDIKKAGAAVLLIVVVIFGFGVVKGMVGKR